ncbi:PREDICTED: receptor activity-modifying protein 1 isoform X1 [Gekko japonicus]|uniref:Receptor activity-modifying protein 1 n=2 Tax=Gekko japonicus TaxID=146911 RepID=A0ABM1L0R0_GEKJA|nr:PREDICTED: receptor activity-modifying protein 1 isoform X1 [Gekko japonicus]
MGQHRIRAPDRMVVTGCHEAAYGHFVQEFCFSRFKSDMGTLRQTLWCDWEKTFGWYGELINCTFLIATKLDCYWPNKLVDEFFIGIHQHYFKSCPVSGRSLHDPPNTVLCPFIVVPIFVTLLMTAVVVWRSKRSEGIV